MTRAKSTFTISLYGLYANIHLLLTERESTNAKVTSTQTYIHFHWLKCLYVLYVFIYYKQENLVRSLCG